jgi:hypothetical protein
MNTQQLLETFWLAGGLLLIALSTFTITLLVAWIAAEIRNARSFFGWPERYEALSLVWIGLPLAIVAITTGYLTGNSREAAVQALVPALLGLVSAGMLALLSLRREVVWPIGVAVSLFAVDLLIGSSIGATVRDNENERHMAVEYQAFEAEREATVNAYRKAIDLEPLPPGGKAGGGKAKKKDD